MIIKVVTEFFIDLPQGDLMSWARRHDVPLRVECALVKPPGFDERFQMRVKIDPAEARQPSDTHAQEYATLMGDENAYDGEYVWASSPDERAMFDAVCQWASAVQEVCPGVSIIVRGLIV